MATLVGASGGGFLGGAHLAVTSLFRAPTGVALGPALPGPQDLDATGLKNLEFRSRAKTRALCLDKWVPSLWKRLSFLRKVAHGSIKTYAAGFTERF